MEVNPQIREIPVNEIQLVDWIAGRSGEDPNALQLDLLQRSLQPFKIPTSGVAPVLKAGEVPGGPKRIPSNIHDVLETALFSIPVGQLAPIRLLKFPYDIEHNRPYGLIFGLRRLSAARAGGMKTIQVQVVTLDASEYADPTVRFRIMLMAFAENTQRLPLKEGDYIRALKALKTCYHAIHPLAARRTVPIHDTNGRIVDNASKPESEQSFAKAVAQHENVPLRTVQRRLALAEHACDATLDFLTDGVITQTAALALCKAPPDQQPVILESLSKQRMPFTADNISRAIESRPSPLEAETTPANGHSHQESIPDLTIFKYVTRHAINLKKGHQWTPETALQSIDTIAHAAVAMETLEEHVREFANQAFAAANGRR